MYFYMLSFICFCLCHLKRNNSKIYIVDLLFPLVISILIVYVYFGGEDWVSYHRNYLSEPIVNHMLDLVFVLLFKGISLISLNYFPLTILFFYCFIFYLIKMIFLKYNIGGIKGYYIFLSLLIFTLGPTLVAEQLRQLLSMVLFLLFFLCLIENDKNYRLFAFLSIFSHTSSLIFVVFTFALLMFKSKKNLLYLFVITSISAWVFFSLLEGASSYDLPILSSVVNKYIAYKQYTNPGDVGILHVLNFIIILLYFCFYNYKENKGEVNDLLVRLIVFSAFIYVLSVWYPFLTRVLSSGVFLYCVYLSLAYVKRQSKINILTLYNLLFFVLLSLSYYKNSSAPFDFVGVSENDYSIPWTTEKLNTKIDVINQQYFN